MRKAEQISDQEQFSEVMREIHEQLFEFLTVHIEVAAGRERTQAPQLGDLGRGTHHRCLDTRPCSHTGLGQVSVRALYG